MITMIMTMSLRRYPLQQTTNSQQRGTNCSLRNHAREFALRYWMSRTAAMWIIKIGPTSGAVAPLLIFLTPINHNNINVISIIFARLVGT